MPIYTYECTSCGHREDQHSSVKWRDLPSTCGRCGCEAPRIFAPTVNIVVPAAFQLDMDWAGTGGEGQSLSGRSQIRKPQVPSLKSEFDKVKDWL